MVWSYLSNKYLKLQTDKDGYLVVKLRDNKNNTYVTKFIHRLIAEAYIPNPDNKETVDHIDGNSDNNSEENLRLICPNCHSLTSTYRGANRGHGRNITWTIKN